MDRKLEYNYYSPGATIRLKFATMHITICNGHKEKQYSNRNPKYFDQLKQKLELGTRKNNCGQIRI